MEPPTTNDAIMQRLDHCRAMYFLPWVLGVQVQLKGEWNGLSVADLMRKYDEEHAKRIHASNEL